MTFLRSDITICIYKILFTIQFNFSNSSLIFPVPKRPWQ